MKKVLNLLSNIFLAGVIVFFIFQRLPGMIDQYRSEGTPAPLFTLPLSNGKTFDLTEMDQPLILVFWATWCGPCEVELSRINRLIENNEIPAESVLALSSLESADLVKTTSAARGYHFSVATDPSGKIAAAYKVAGTPTLVFIDRQKKINWITTGLSPSLEFRIRLFLKH